MKNNRPVTKKKVTYTIDIELLEMLERVSDRLGLKKSQLVEQVMLEILPKLDQSSPQNILEHALQELEEIN
ncbi:MAG: Unknown protein [uncultured Sulfurovum sp.]|uniref:Ribbon-helix-helix protein CopG domain-containing protein n=1 Tax=uncultured Sulfurovum sp. TaxID=269237 RepID=A0A6S6S9N0_9BACT|nr:MAG: Unknown protein [uncultured Sulfurovum sp.]